jgi:hypothetical protein
MTERDDGGRRATGGGRLVSPRVRGGTRSRPSPRSPAAPRRAGCIGRVRPRALGPSSRWWLTAGTGSPAPSAGRWDHRNRPAVLVATLPRPGAGRCAMPERVRRSHPPFAQPVGARSARLPGTGSRSRRSWPSDALPGGPPHALPGALRPDLPGSTSWPRACRRPPARTHWAPTSSRVTSCRASSTGPESRSPSVSSRFSSRSRSGPSSGRLGIRRGAVDSIVMRFVDMVISFPRLILLITIIALFEPSIFLIVAVLGLTQWPQVTRIVRGEVLSCASGSSSRPGGAGLLASRIILRHVIPNVLAPVIVAATLGIGDTIVLEAGLSFLGLGVQPPPLLGDDGRRRDGTTCSVPGGSPPSRGSPSSSPFFPSTWRGRAPRRPRPPSGAEWTVRPAGGA